MTEERTTDHIKERLATLEAANKYHKDSLDEISKTLKEVVKIQGMLANQREEMLKISESLNSFGDVIHQQDKLLSNTMLEVQSTKNELHQLKDELKECQIKTANNTRFVKNASWVLTSILVPLVIAVVAALI